MNKLSIKIIFPILICQYNTQINYLSHNQEASGKSWTSFLPSKCRNPCQIAAVTMASLVIRCDFSVPGDASGQF